MLVKRVQRIWATMRYCFLRWRRSQAISTIISEWEVLYVVRSLQGSVKASWCCSQMLRHCPKLRWISRGILRLQVSRQLSEIVERASIRHVIILQRIDQSPLFTHSFSLRHIVVSHCPALRLLLQISLWSLFWHKSSSVCFHLSIYCFSRLITWT